MDRKQPLWPTVIVPPLVLALLYLASFGPACWLVDRGLMSEQPVRFAYGGLIAWLQAHENERPARALRFWAGLASPFDGRPFWYWDEMYPKVPVLDPI